MPSRSSKALQSVLTLDLDAAFQAALSSEDAATGSAAHEALLSATIQVRRAAPRMHMHAHAAMVHACTAAGHRQRTPMVCTMMIAMCIRRLGLGSPIDIDVGHEEGGGVRGGDQRRRAEGVGRDTCRRGTRRNGVSEGWGSKEAERVVVSTLQLVFSLAFTGHV